MVQQFRINKNGTANNQANANQIRSPPRNIAASEHTTVRSALLITTTAESNLLERRAERCGIRSPPLTTLETTYAERCFPPRSRPSHRSHLSHRTPPSPTAEKVARRAFFKTFARTQCVHDIVLVEFRTSLERGEQDGQKLLRLVVLRCLPEAPVGNPFRRPLSRPRDVVTSLLMASPRGILASDRIQR